MIDSLRRFIGLVAATMPLGEAEAQATRRSFN
jgi:hypothetical protein